MVGDLVNHDNTIVTALNESLAGVDWTFQTGRLFPLQLPTQDQEVFFKKGEAHDAYVHIRGIVQSAASEVLLVDPFIDDSIYTVLKTANQPNLSTRILARERNLPKDFPLEAEKFFQQHTSIASLQARTTEDIHDRFIVIDNKKVYLLGASIKDAGKKACAIVLIEQGQIVGFILEYLTDVWNASAEILAHKR